MEIPSSCFFFFKYWEEKLKFWLSEFSITQNVNQDCLINPYSFNPFHASINKNTPQMAKTLLLDCISSPLDNYFTEHAKHIKSHLKQKLKKLDNCPDNLVSNLINI